MKNNLTSGSARLDKEPAANDIGRKRAERLTKTMANTSKYIRTDRKWETKQDILSSNKSTPSRKESYLKTRSVFSAEQSAIIEAIQSEKNSRHKIVTITDSLSTIMAAESSTPTKNPKTQTIRKMLDRELPSYGSPFTRKNQVTLDEEIPTTERYPPDNLKKWLTEEDFKKETKDGKTETTR
jgi:hypothetical protein